MASSAKSLMVRDLVKTYKGRCVVNEVTLGVQPGQIVGLLGPNGAGKSTTFYSVVGIIRPDRGAVILNGENIILMPMYLRARKGVTYLSQEPSVFRKLTVEENLLAILETMNIGRQEQRLRLKALLADLNISHLAKNRADRLSGGERRRVEISRALVTQPRLLLVDEMSLGLAPVIVERLLPILRRAADELGASVLFVEQHVALALEISDRAYVLTHGRIRLEGPAAELRERRELLAASYLGETAA